jgi:hypothetical protein
VCLALFKFHLNLKGVVMKKFILATFIGLVACQTNPTMPSRPEQVLGRVRLEFLLSEGGKTLKAQNLSSVGGAVQMQLLQTNTFTYGSRANGGERFLSVTYNVRNAQSNGTAYATDNSNITFLAVSTSSSLGETAVANIKKYDGTAMTSSTLAQAFKPTHGMRYNLNSNALESNPGAEDFQIFDESEISAFSSASLVPLNYGFVVRRTNSGATNRTLAANPSANQFDGRVTFAMRFPLQTIAAEDPHSFAMDFLVMTDSETRVTQSLEQQRSLTLPADATTLTGVSINTFTGTFYFSNSNQRHINNVRLARAVGNNPVYLQTQTQSTIVVNSNADAGVDTVGAVGTLRQALKDAVSWATIDLSGINNQDIVLSSPLVLSRPVIITNSATSPNVRLLGGVNAYNAANVQVIQVPVGVTVTLSNFAIENGYVTGTPARGAGIHNLGILQLNNMTLKNNLARGNNGLNGRHFINLSQTGTDGGAGGTAQGAAIFNSGSLQVSNSIFSANQTIGGSGGQGGNGGIYSNGITPPSIIPGRPGGNGGAAQGGAIFHQAGTLSLNNSTFGLNSAVGGNGGNGGSQSSTYAIGGNGGDASGGANYKAGTDTPTVSNLTYQTNPNNNSVTAGVAGGGASATATHPDANF